MQNEKKSEKADEIKQNFPDKKKVECKKRLLGYKMGV